MTSYEDMQNKIQGFMGSVQNTWFALTDKQKVATAVLASVLVAGGGTMVYNSLFSLDAQLKDWNENYESLCYNPRATAEEDNFSAENDLDNQYDNYAEKYNIAEPITRTIFSQMNKSWLGQNLVNQFNDDKTIFCFGPKTGLKQDIEHWRFHDVYLVAEKTPEINVTNHLMDNFTYKTGRKVAHWSADLRPADALFWARARVANHYAAHVENMHKAASASVGSSLAWQEFLKDPKYGLSAEIYEEALGKTNQTPKEARLSVFKAVIKSPVVDDIEEGLLGWYLRELDDVDVSYTYPCMDFDGNPSLCTGYTTEPPDRTRNALDTNPQNLSAMTAPLFNETQGYITETMAADIMNDRSLWQPHTPEGKEIWSKIEERIADCCDKNRTADSADDGLSHRKLNFSG